MRKLKPSLQFFLCSLVFLTGCKALSGNGRSELSLLSGNSKSASARDEFTRFKIVHDDPRIEQVRRVGYNIVREGLKHDLHEVLPPVEKWEFEVIRDRSPNAFVFPDGKVGFNTGMFSYVETDDDVAVILGHEVADILMHVTQEHIVGSPAEQSPRTELEADHLGLIIMARAGYNPEAAPLFWRRFSAAPTNRAPEYFSSHPLDDTRINKLQGWMQEAKALAEPLRKP